MHIFSNLTHSLQHYKKLTEIFLSLESMYVGRLKITGICHLENCRSTTFSSQCGGMHQPTILSCPNPNRKRPHVELQPKNPLIAQKGNAAAMHLTITPARHIGATVCEWIKVISNHDKSTKISFYSALMRPHLMWSPKRTSKLKYATHFNYNVLKKYMYDNFDHVFSCEPD